MGNTGLEKALEETLAVFEWLCKEGKNNNDSDENGIIIKEENVKIKLVLPILKCLGWDIIKDIDFEFSIVPKFIDIEHFKERKVRVDCCFMKNGKPVLLLDVKAFKNKSKIDKESELQLKSYCISKNIPCGVITDGFRWVLYGFFAGKVDADIETSNEVIRKCYLEKKDINQIVDLLSMFSYANIDTLYDKVMCSRILNSIWNERLEFYINNGKKCEESIATLVDKYKHKILVMKPDLKIYDDYLGKDIERKLLERCEKKEKKFTEKSGRLCVTFPDGTIFNESYDVDTFRKTLMKIGMEKVASMNFQSNNVPLVSKVPYIVTKKWMSAYNKEKYDGYYVMAHGNADDDFMPFIEKIKEELVKTDPDFKKLIVKVRANN